MVDDEYIIYILERNSQRWFFIDSNPSKRWARLAEWDGDGLPPHGPTVVDKYHWGLVGRCGHAAFYHERIEESFWNALRGGTICTVNGETPDFYRPELLRQPVSREELSLFLESLPVELKRVAENRRLSHILPNLDDYFSMAITGIR